MWEKIQIYKTAISEYAHEGFIIEYRRNSISNLVKNYSIPLPFKLFPVLNLYSYELMFTKEYLILNILINLDCINHKLTSHDKIPFKNELFHMCKYIYSKKSPHIIPFFRKLRSIEKLIDKFEIIPYKQANIFEIYNLSLDLTSEKIYETNPNTNIFCQDIFFIFCSNIIPFVHKKICLIDDTSKYNSEYNVIHKNNYKKITKSFFNNGLIVIDKHFFMSKTYLNGYKDFHSIPNSIHAFNNYKEHVDHMSCNQNFINIELLSNFTIMLNDIDIDKMFNHPIKFTTQKKFFIFSDISNKKIQSSCKYIQDYYKSKFNQMVDTNSFMNRILFLPEYLHFFYNTLSNIDLKLDYPKNLDINYKITDCEEKTICPINRCQILNHHHYEFTCGHKFIIDDINMFIETYHNCPVCLKHIDTMAVLFNIDTFIIDLFGKSFFDIYNPKDTYFIIGEENNQLSNFTTNNIPNIVFVTDTIEITKSSYLFFNYTYSDYDIINYLKDICVNLIKGIFKISQSI